MVRQKTAVLTSVNGPSDEIILQKVSNMNRSEQILEKTTANRHCLHGIKGHYLGTIWIVSSQTLYFEMYYFITWWTFFSECWCNGLLNSIPFMYQNKYVWVQIHFKANFKHIAPQYVLFRAWHSFGVWKYKRILKSLKRGTFSLTKNFNVLWHQSQWFLKI